MPQMPVSTTARQHHVLGAGPRLQPNLSEDSVNSAMDLTMRLRPAVLPGAVALSADQMPEIMTTLTCHADLWEKVAQVSMQLLGRGVLGRRDAELAILRTSWLCQAPYEWGEHVVQGKAAGLSAREIEDVIIGSTAQAWSAKDRAILGAVEELHADAMVSDPVWAELVTHFDDKQVFELLVLIGQFTNVAYFQNALRLRLPPGNRGLEAR